MYSHLFDNLFLSKMELSEDLIKFLHHEMRSIALGEFIVSKYEIALSKEDLNVVASVSPPGVT